MTYSEIKQRVFDLLFIPFEEANRLHYTDKIPRIINEALFRIAHSVLPNLREYVIKLTHSKLPARISMPPDFISFADEQNAYLDGMQFCLTQFISDNEIILTGHEIDDLVYRPGRLFKPDKIHEYHIFYNANYPRIASSGIDFSVVTFATGEDIPVDADNYTIVSVPAEASRVTGGEVYNIPDIVAELVPHYVVGQLLVLDDKVRSIEEMNEFENLLATINVHRNERPREYHSSKGWY